MTTLTVPRSQPVAPSSGSGGGGGGLPSEYLLMAAAEQKMAGKEYAPKKPPETPREQRQRRELMAQGPDQMSPENIQARIRQLTYDRGLAAKRGVDTTGEDYAPVRNELKRLRDQLKGAS